MPFIDEWTTAKDTFEKTVNGKKPTKKFLGVFRKGTGIESALGSLDKAKTKKEAIKSVAEFDKSVKEYVNLLDKEIADPKSVTTDNKEEYVKALGKLKKALEKVKTKADNVAQTLSDGSGGDKTKVDSKLLQAIEDHLGKQRDAIAKLTKLQNEMSGHLNEVKTFLKVGGKAVLDYRKPSLSDMAMVNSNIAFQAAEKADTLRTGTARKRKQDIYKKVEGAEKTLAQSDSLKSRVSEIPVAQLKESKSQADAVGKLIAAIDKDYEEIGNICVQLGELKKEAAPVNMEAKENCEDHLKLRLRMVQEVTSWEAESKREAAAVAKALKTAQSALVRANDLAKKGNRTDLEKLSGLMGTLLKQEQTRVDKIVKSTEKKTTSGSDLMKARGDVKKDLDELPPSMGKVLRDRINKAFAAMDSMQRKWQDANDALTTSLTELEGIVDQIDTLAGKAKPASYYLAWLNPAAEEMDKEAKLASDRAKKALGMKTNTLPKYQTTEKTPAIIKTIGQHHDIWVGMKEKAVSARKRRDLVEKRLAGVASQEREVVDVVKKIQASIKELDTNYSDFDGVTADVDKLYSELLS